MANYGGENYTNFKGINFKNTGFIRAELDGGLNGTLSVKASPDASLAWQFPAKSGTFPITGTFTVDLPTVLTNKQVYSTLVTVSGIRAEDALTVSFVGETGTYTYGGSTTMYILSAAKPGNGNITLTFQNLGQGTGYLDDLIFAYTAAR